MIQKFIITGASGGIGSATARLLAGEQTSLVIQATHPSNYLDALIKELRDKGASVALLTADFRLESEVVSFFEQAVETFSDSPITGLVNAAGLDLMTPEIKALSFSQRLKEILAVDLEASVLLSRRMVELIRKESLIKEDLASLKNDQKRIRPTIILFGWSGTERGMSGETAQLYALVKGGIVAFMRSLAQDMGELGRVCAVSPGWIQTRWGQQASPLATNRAENESLAHRWGTPEEVASVIFFLLSEKSSFINGQNIVIDGGFDYSKKEQRSLI